MKIPVLLPENGMAFVPVLVGNELVSESDCFEECTISMLAISVQCVVCVSVLLAYNVVSTSVLSKESSLSVL